MREKVEEFFSGVKIALPELHVSSGLYMRIKAEIEGNMIREEHRDHGFIECVLLADAACEKCDRFETMLSGLGVPFRLMQVNSLAGRRMQDKTQIFTHVPVFSHPDGEVFFTEVPTEERLSEWFEQFYGRPL